MLGSPWRQCQSVVVRRLSFLVLLLSFTSGLPLLAADLTVNGISVGPPKLFDNRTLQIMLDQLNEQLQVVRVVDQQKLVDSLTKQQGAEVSDVSRSLSLTTPIQPQVVTKETPDAQGSLKPSERTTTAGSVTPAAPALPELIAAPSYTPTFGTSAPDMLADQVSLSYQIFNMRMLLDRSLTDRVLEDGQPRLQAVLGFQISLNPPKWARNHAAYVEITVAPSGTKPVSLVAMMPFEKTYNSSALSTKSNDFGGSAVAKILTIGYHERRRQQVFYIFRDADTLALGDLQSPKSQVATFGWTFRPVLGRKSVTPGVRQMFAVVSLPASDIGEQVENLSVSARTYWRPYSHSTLTAKERREAIIDWDQAVPLKVYTSEFIDRNLSPIVRKVEWAATGTDVAVVTINGANFFPGTRIFVGNKTYDSPATGLVLKSDRTLELRTSPTDLAFGEAVLSGRYGGRERVEGGGCEGCGIAIDEVSNRAVPNGDQVLLTVKLRFRMGNEKLELDERPLLTVGNTYIPGPYIFANQTLIAMVPSSLLTKDTLVGVRFPFRGIGWADAVPATTSPSYKVIRLGSTDPIKLLVQGEDFNSNWKVRLDQVYAVGNKLELLGTTLLALEAPKEAADYKKLVLIPDNQDPVVLDIPPTTPLAPKASLDIQPPVSVTKGASPGVAFKGANLGLVKKVWSSAGKELFFQVSEDAKQITVFLTAEVTKEAGPATVLLETADGVRIPANLTVVP
ncbi:MAG TPA: hypothetical protein VJ725_07215 [Thermoanaerobaculia bacterium]|nr:hypothetical protein [Thermoanaerobaculia bacterium]